MAYVYSEWEEAINAGNARNNIIIKHYVIGSVPTTGQQTLASGINVSDYDAYSISAGNNHATVTYNLAVYGCNASGTACLAYNGSVWGMIGTAKTIMAGGANLDAWETTKCKWLLLAGSASDATSGGFPIDLFLKMRA